MKKAGRDTRLPLFGSHLVRTLSNSQLLRNKISLFSKGLDKVAYEFWMHPEFARVYPEYLFQSHSIIRASVPLMETTLAVCRAETYKTDPVLKMFGDYLARHIEEERGHDNWILDDAEAMGIERSCLLDRIPKETAMRMVGSQYYWIHHYHPVAMLGYIAVMEGTPPKTEFVKDVASRNSLSPEAFSSFLLHAKVDPKHRADLDALLDELPLSQNQHAIIGLSALQTTQYLKTVLAEVNNSHRC
jgi:pyrroloquinoline quinone (PQQ) biosynthesis protein C